MTNQNGATNTASQKPYNFQNQLELGELLLELGRTQEATIELRKAVQLCEIETENPPTVSEKARLSLALTQVEGLSFHQETQSRRLWMVGTLLLLTLLGAIFTLWIFNRSELVQTVANSTAAAQEISAKQTELAQIAVIAGMENTRTVEEIIKQRNELATAQAVNAQIADIASARSDFGTMEAMAAMVAASATESASSSQATVGALIAAQSTATRTPIPTRTPRFTPTPSVPVWDQLRVTTAGSNLRRGPGMTYRIIGTLRQNDVVGLLGQDSTGLWYNVITEDNAIGWLHQSLASPLAVDSIPVIVDVPPSPVFVPSATPVPATPELILPTNTPDGAVAPTAEVEPSPEVQATATAEIVVTDPTATVEVTEPTATTEANGELTELPEATATVAIEIPSPTPTE